MRYVFLGFAFVVILYIVFGCADMRPPCSETPRNMSCMTADQLERELSK